MPSYGPDAKDDDILSAAKEAFQEASDAESDNREQALEDLRFARLGEQWPEEVAKQREVDRRPMLTINRLPPFIRQVVNDARQNKPSAKVHPVDSKGDPETAEIYNGILRHIEYNSRADIAYDTAVDSAVTMSFGYWRISLDYAHDDTFDMELGIRAVSDPFTIYGDPWATSVDGSDWNTAFVVERMSLQRFEREYPGADRSSWSSADDMETTDWRGKDMAQLAEYWTREEIEREIVQLSDGSVVTAEQLLTDENRADRRPDADDSRLEGQAVYRFGFGGAGSERMEGQIHPDRSSLWRCDC